MELIFYLGIHFNASITFLLCVMEILLHMHYVPFCGNDPFVCLIIITVIIIIVNIWVRFHKKGPAYIINFQCKFPVHATEM